jgi:hypothetical protein
VVRFVLEGHMEAVFADHIQEIVEAALANGASPHVFLDAAEATSLDSQFRVRLTPWHKQIAPKVQSQNILVRSKIVAMAVSVVNMGIGHVLKAFSHRPHFEAVMAAARK